MDSVLAFTTKDAAIVVTDMSTNQDIFVLDQNSDKIKELFGKHLLVVTGDPGDACSHTDYIIRNLYLQYYRKNKVAPTINHCVNWIRQGVWEAIRDSPLKINVLYAGMDQNNTPSLYTIDSYGALIQPKYIAQNYSMYFILSVFDKYWKEEMNQEEIVALVKQCITVLNRRMMLQQHKFLVKVVTKDGVKQEVIDYIPEMLKAHK